MDVLKTYPFLYMDVFFLLNSKWYLHILDSSPMSDKCFINIFFQSVVCFYFLIVSFKEQVFNFNEICIVSPKIILAFWLWLHWICIPIWKELTSWWYWVFWFRNPVYISIYLHLFSFSQKDWCFYYTDFVHIWQNSSLSI